MELYINGRCTHASMISNVTETKNNHLGIFYLGGSLLDPADIGTPYLPAVLAFLYRFTLSLAYVVG